MPHTRHLRTLIALAAALLTFTGCGGDDDAFAETEAESATAATTTIAPATTVAEIPLDSGGVPPADYAGFRLQETACGAEPPPERVLAEYPAPEDMGIDPASRPVATISTSCGDVTVELDPSMAPATVNSFVFLAESGYFDGTASHRIAPGFVLQAGDPTATGSGGPGYVVPDENPPADFVYERGVLAMANAGANTTGSQFFIMLGNAGLPPSFSVFGRVTSGFDVLDTIATIPLGVGRSGEQSTPLLSLYLDEVTIER